MSQPSQTLSHATRVSSGEGTFSPPKITAALALAGIAGPLLAGALLLIAQSLHPGYNPIEDSISRLSFGPFGWVQTLNYCQLALSIVAFGAAVRLGLARTRRGRISGFLFMAMGLDILVVSLFHVDANPYAPKSVFDIIHQLAATLSGVLFPAAALFLAMDLWSDPKWLPEAKIALAAALIVLIMQIGETSQFFATQYFAPVFGLYERLLASIGLAWIVFMSIILLRAARRT